MGAVVCQGDDTIVKLMVIGCGHAGLRSRHRSKFLHQGWATQLTWKSTEAHIKTLARSGRLVHFEPELEFGDVWSRRLWLHPTVSEWVGSEGDGAKRQRYFDGVRDFLKTFVTGDDFDNDVLLKPLTTNLGAWYEFKIIFDPHHRIIGGFLRPGEFVALAHETRKNLDEKGFAPAISRASRLWNNLALGSRPLTDKRSFLLEDFHHDED